MPLYFSRKIYISTCFTNLKIIWRVIFAFITKRQKKKIVFSICFAESCYRGSVHSSRERGTTSFLSLGTTYSSSASRHHISKLCLWVSVLYLDLFVVATNAMCLNLIFCLPYIISPQNVFCIETLSDGRGHLHYFLSSATYFAPKSSGNFRSLPWM